VISVTDYSEGQYVTAAARKGPRVVYKIVDSTPVNWKLDRVAGGRGLLVRKGMEDLVVRPATEAEVKAAEAARPAIQIKKGFVVLYKHPAAAGHLYVAFKIHPDGTFDLIQLGGSNKFWPKVHPAHVTVVDADKIEAAYREHGGEL
jgi:hypothetical protein